MENATVEVTSATSSAKSTTPTSSAKSTTPTSSVESTSATSSAKSTTPTSSVESTPTTAPIVKQTNPAQVDNQLQSQVKALHKELQIWKMRSAMSERHIQAHDFDLVARLVSENIDKFGGDIDKCVSDLYSKSQYLFKIPKTDDTKVVDKEKIQSDNKKLIEGAIARLSRAKIKF